MDKRKKECCICSKSGCSYKCPKCLSPYCSSACCTTHKESCSTFVLSATGDNAEKKHDEIGNQVALLTDMSADSVATVKSKATELVILQPTEKEGIVQSQELRSLLKSKRLRDDIALVDSSKDRQAALKALRARNPEFNSFVDVLLTCVNPAAEK